MMRMWLCASALVGAVTACGSDGADPLTPDGDPAVIDSDPGTIDATPPASNFSFFVTSMAAMQRLAGDPDGFGGDFRYGQTGAGAGLRGADAICAEIAEASLTGAGAKPWRAFLSVSDGGDGNPVNAIDRIGTGPWHDRLGRVVAMTITDLPAIRPLNGDPTITNDLPNEDGVPNHQPDLGQPEVDNHDTLTGSDALGRFESIDDTCLDWTSKVGDVNTEGRPMTGHSWPRVGGGGGSDGAHWLRSHPAGGCAAGINIFGSGGPPPGDFSVGAGGGYGGIYCFALTP